MEITDDGTARAPFISMEEKKKKKDGEYIKCSMDENIRKACDAVSNSRYTTRSTMVSSKFSGKGRGSKQSAEFFTEEGSDLHGSHTLLIRWERKWRGLAYYLLRAIVLARVSLSLSLLLSFASSYWGRLT